MKILAIETSCDETSAAVVENGRKIISNIVASSFELHLKTGGVIPEIAAREQLRCIIPVIKEALSITDTKDQGPMTTDQIDALAVTFGPGLIGSLLVGVETAKTLSYVWQKPIIPVNHLVAHLYANWLGIKTPRFPALCLIVSGGHTELVMMKNHGKLTYFGGTRDDAAGEAFDKTARLLELAPYNGGPAIAKAAEEFKIKNLKLKISLLPRPMINTPDFDFSFSGLKTAVLREVERLKILKQFNNQTINQLAYEIQESITDCLVSKLIKAAKQINPKSILLAGGVSANQRLKEKVMSEVKKENLDLEIFIPPPNLCTDNAAYIGACAFFNYHPCPWKKISADPSLDIV